MDSTASKTKTSHIKEWLGVAVTVLGLVGIPLWVTGTRSAQAPPDRRVIALTGVMKDGVWTAATVMSRLLC